MWVKVCVKRSGSIKMLERKNYTAERRSSNLAAAHYLHVRRRDVSSTASRWLNKLALNIFFIGRRIPLATKVATSAGFLSKNVGTSRKRLALMNLLVFASPQIQRGGGSTDALHCGTLKIIHKKASSKDAPWAVCVKNAALGRTSLCICLGWMCMQMTREFPPSKTRHGLRLVCH